MESIGRSFCPADSAQYSPPQVLVTDHKLLKAVKKAEILPYVGKDEKEDSALNSLPEDEAAAYAFLAIQQFVNCGLTSLNESWANGIVAGVNFLDE